VVENVEKLIMPLIDDLKLGLPRQCAAVLDILASRLVEIVSPFTAALSHHSAGLSPAEIRLCDLIRRGMSSDQIAQHEHISPATVRKHREHIRRKLGIQGEQVSLVQHLEGFMRGSAY
jgi:DNA-binding CsgD family transcriptional regulator